MRSAVEVVCPACRQELRLEESGAECTACARRYPLHHGILSFLDAGESLNPTSFQEKQEQAWSTSAQLRDRIRQSRLLSLVNRLRITLSMSGRRDRIFYSEMRGRSKDQLILDVGCGGGRHYFTEYGRVVGVDPVMDLLQISKSLYGSVYHASATALPFRDATFDYVVSSDVMGHIPVEMKDQVFAEMFRVLRPGGRTVHVIETDADNIWYRFAHRYPELFREYLVERPGHISLEMPTALRARFLKHGFREVRFKKYAGAIQECGTLAGMFDNEYARKSASLRMAVALDRLLARNLVVRELTNVVLEPLAQVADGCTDLDNTNGALVVYEKPNALA